MNVLSQEGQTARAGTPAKKLKVALVALHFAEYSWLLAKALACEHDVLLVLDHGAAKDELCELPRSVPGLQVVGVDRRRGLRGLIKGVEDIAALLKVFAPDVLHFQEVATPLGISLSLRLRYLPLVLTVHDPTPHSGDDHFSLSQIRQRGTLRLFRSLCDVAITHGEALAADLTSSLPRLTRRTFSVPHGPLGGPKATAPSEPGNFLFFGRIQQYKGLGFFVDALIHLHDQMGLKVKGVIAGRGPDLEPYRARIANHPAFELQERFIREDELPGLFARAQAVVLPYTDGTQSGVAAMALGFGRPVVSTRVGAVQEMVRDGENGLLVPPRDAKALAAALQRLMQEPGLAEAMGAHSYALGQGELSWARNAAISAKAYAQAIALRRN